MTVILLNFGRIMGGQKKFQRKAQARAILYRDLTLKLSSLCTPPPSLIILGFLSAASDNVNRGWKPSPHIPNTLDNVEKELKQLQQLLLPDEKGTAAITTPLSNLSFETAEGSGNECNANLTTNKNFSLAELLSDMYWECTRIALRMIADDETRHALHAFSGILWGMKRGNNHVTTTLNEAIFDTERLSSEDIVYSEYLADELNHAFGKCKAGKNEIDSHLEEKRNISNAAGNWIFAIYTKELMLRRRTCVQAILLPLSQLRFTRLSGGEYQEVIDLASSNEAVRNILQSHGATVTGKMMCLLSGYHVGVFTEEKCIP